MKNNLLKTLIILLAVSFIGLQGCQEDLSLLKKNEILTPDMSKKMSSGILQVSYEITTWTDYEMPKKELSNLDMSSLNPMSDKQKITMEISKNGEVSMTIDKLDFKNNIKIPHKTPPSDIPEIVRTEIFGNTAYFYTKNKKLVNSEYIEIPNQTELVEKIKKLGNKFSAEDVNQAMATMQGQFFADNLDEFIDNAIKNGAHVIEQGDSYITLRISLKQKDQNIEQDVVLLIDRNINKVVGSRIYNAKNELLQTIYYGYNKGKVQSLKAIRVEEKTKLPSGKEVKMIISSKIEKLKFNLNI